MGALIRGMMAAGLIAVLSLSVGLAAKSSAAGAAWAEHRGAIEASLERASAALEEADLASAGQGRP